MTVGKWLGLTDDHGYNGSPASAVIGGGIARLLPATDASMALLLSLENLLYIVMWAIVWNTFGWLPASAALLFWGCNYVAGNWFTVGSYVRSDWLIAAVLGVCALRRERHGLAGFLLGYATLARVFPGFLLGGVALAGLLEMIRRRSFAVPPDVARVAAGALLAFAIVFPVSALMAGGFDAWSDFLSNTLKHRESGSSQNIALATSLSYFDQPSLSGLERMLQFASPRTMRHFDHTLRDALAAALSLLLLSVAVARERPWVAAILGLAWLPFVAGISNYYWACGLLFALLLDRKAEVALVYAPFLVAWAGIGLVFGYLNYNTFMLGSGSLIAFVVALLSMFALDTLRANPANADANADAHADAHADALEMAESPAASRRLG
jgi:hypothetical protein